MKLLLRVLAFACLPVLFITDGVATQTVKVNQGIVPTNFLLLKKKNNIVFLTSTTHDGNLGGLSGADSICQDLATIAGLPGTYLAWLSDSTNSPSTRFIRATVPYVLTDGTQIADDWSDLTDGNIDAPINVDEKMQSYSDLGRTWTNTKGDGTIKTSSHNCENWTATPALSSSQAGDFFSQGLNWTDASQADCKTDLRLYCFQQ